MKCLLWLLMPLAARGRRFTPSEAVEGALDAIEVSALGGRMHFVNRSRGGPPLRPGRNFSNGHGAALVQFQEEMHEKGPGNSIYKVDCKVKADESVIDCSDKECIDTQDCAETRTFAVHTQTCTKGQYDSPMTCPSSSLYTWKTPIIFAQSWRGVGKMGWCCICPYGKVVEWHTGLCVWKAVDVRKVKINQFINPKTAKTMSHYATIATDNENDEFADVQYDQNFAFDMAANTPEKACTTRSFFRGSCPSSAMGLYNVKVDIWRGYSQASCCLCPAFSRWDKAKGECVCQPYVLGSPPPAMIKRECPPPQGDKVKALQKGEDIDVLFKQTYQQMDWARAGCVGHRWIEELSDGVRDKDWAVRKGGGFIDEDKDSSDSSFMLEKVDIYKMNIEFNVEPNEDGKIQIEVAHGGELEIGMKNIVLYKAGRRIQWNKASGYTVIVPAYMKGRDLLDDIKAHGTSYGIEMELGDIDFAGSNIPNFMVNWFKGKIMENVIRPMMGSIFTGVAINLRKSSVDAAPTEDGFEFRNKYPIRFAMMTPKRGGQCRRGWGMCLAYRMTSGQKEALPPVGEWPEPVMPTKVDLDLDFDEKTIQESTTTLYMHVDTIGAIRKYAETNNGNVLKEGTGEATEVTGMKSMAEKELEALSQTQTGLFDGVDLEQADEPAEDEGIDQEIARKAKMAPFTESYTACKKRALETRGHMIKASLANGMVQAMMGVKALWDARKGTKKAILQDKCEPGPKRAEFESKLVEAWLEKRHGRAGILGRSAAPGEDPTFDMKSVSQILLFTDGKITLTPEAPTGRTVIKGDMKIHRLELRSLVWDYCEPAQGDPGSEHEVDPAECWVDYTGVFPEEGLDVVVNPVEFTVSGYSDWSRNDHSTCVDLKEPPEVLIENQYGSYLANKLIGIFGLQYFIQDILSEQIAAPLKSACESPQASGTVEVSINTMTETSAFTLLLNANMKGMSEAQMSATGVSIPKRPPLNTRERGSAWTFLMKAMEGVENNNYILEHAMPKLSRDPSTWTPAGYFYELDAVFHELDVKGYADFRKEIPVDLGGTFVMNLQNMIRAVANDNGAYNGYPAATAYHDEVLLKVVKEPGKDQQVRLGKAAGQARLDKAPRQWVQGILSCGYLYLVAAEKKDPSGPSLLEGDVIEYRWFQKLDLMSTYWTYKEQTRNSFLDHMPRGSKQTDCPDGVAYVGRRRFTEETSYICVPKGSLLQQAMDWEKEKEQKMRNLIIEGFRTPFHWACSSPMKEGPFEWKFNANDNADASEEHVRARCAKKMITCATFLPCKAVEFTDDNRCVPRSDVDINTESISVRGPYIYKEWEVGQPQTWAGGA